MNSSLLVPGIIVVAVTAGIFVFGESLFSGDASEAVNEYAVSQPKAKESVDTKVSATGSDFSWDESTPETAQSPIKKPAKSFVSTKQSDEAPSELYGLGDDSQEEENFDSAGDFAADDLGSSDDSFDVGPDEFEPALDLQAASQQIDDDLGDFFKNEVEETGSDSSTARSSVRKRVETPSAPRVKAVERSDLEEVAVATSNSSDPLVNGLDDFDSGSSDFAPASRTKVNEEMKSVFMSQEKKTAPKQSAVAMSSDDATSVIPGALEPVQNSNNQPAMGGSKNKLSASTAVRKFKITNPKETTLPVTMSVDGKQVTLKPDQSYVIQESDGDVEVTFSRGGSFGFEKKTLKKGHYRFTVSREAGWKLIN